MTKPSLYSFTLAGLRDHFISNGLPKFSADQVYQWVFQKMIFDMNEWSNVSKKTKTFLQEKMELGLPSIVWHGLSKDGTRKFLLRLADNQTIETVIIPARERQTICVSSQVGCAIGCTFCHTGTQGLKRHLSTEEIVGQFMAVTLWMQQNGEPEFRLTNMVYMGQGEPLHNYENVKQATIIFREDKGIGFGQRRITLSTSGLVPQIEKLGDFPPVNIAISLHAAHNNIRTELMPINKVYDLERLFSAIKTIPLKAHRRITYEYLLIADLNDRQEDIDGLCRLINTRESKINLIPFNEYPGSDFKRPSNEKIQWFQDQLIKRGFVCTTRATKGQDILAACGQLKSHVEKLNIWPAQKPSGDQISTPLA